MNTFKIEDLTSKDKILQKNAIDYFSSLSLDNLSEIAKLFESNPKTENGFIYAVVLGRAGNKDAIDKMILYLQNKNYSIQKQAEIALIAIGKNAVEPLLKATAIDDDILLQKIIHIMRNMNEINVPLMLKMLENGTKPMKLIAISVLSKIKNDEKITISLVKALANNDTDIDKAVCNALIEQGERVIPIIQKVFKNCNSRIAELLMDVLFKIGQPAYKLLYDLLDSPELYLRRHAPYAIRFAHDEATIKKMIDVLNDSDYFVCESAYKYLVYNLKHAGYTIVKRLSESMIAMQQKKADQMLSENQIHWLIKVLATDFDNFSEHILLYMKNPDEIREGQIPITQSLKLSLASAVASNLNPTLVARLIKWLGDESYFVRENAINILSEYGHNFVPEIVMALGDPKEEVRLGIISVLQNIKDVAFNFLLENLKLGNNEMRYNCAYALGFLNDKSAINHLRNALSDGNDWVREYAMISLGRLGDYQTLTSMLPKADDKTKLVISKALSFCGDSAFDLLYESLVKASVDKREAIARAIMELGPQIKNKIQKLMETEENENVRFWLLKINRNLDKKTNL